MPQLADLSPQAPDEITDYSVEFAASVPSGAAVSDTTWGLAVRATLPGATADATPASRLSGSSTLAGSITEQRIAGLVDGNDYVLTVVATMDDGQAVEVWTHLPCRAPT